VQTALPGLHGHVENAWTEATGAMWWAAQWSRLALVGVGRARAPSREGRWQRLVANSRLAMAWKGWVLADAGEVSLILDETPNGNRLRGMKLARQIRGRAVAGALVPARCDARVASPAGAGLATESGEEPWLLITGLPASRNRCRQSRNRMRVEEGFRHEKSSGFPWQHSRIRDPSHSSRLLLLRALAIRLGLLLIKTGQRHRLERPHRRTYSVFPLGLRHVSCLAHAHGPPP
jgi:hypothetical protein